MKKKQVNLKILYGLTFITSIVYIVWRIFFTLPLHAGIVAAIAGIALVVAELVGMVEGLEHCVGMTKRFSPERPEIALEDYPEVDVFISTYNEDPALLYKTINGCKHMDYPDPSKVHIYICDDGRRMEMLELAQKMGVNYKTRKENESAKAGNLNHALEITHSPLVVTFDADMIPLHDFLMSTVPYFFLPDYEKKEDGHWVKRKERDEKLKIGFIQTPQSFYNVDLFQYNLYGENKLPNEQDYFFRDVNVGRNYSNACIYAGSNTVISRKALEEVGGLYIGVVTEDFATGIKIQEAGYTCYAIDEIHAIGLAPGDLKSLIKQRERWGRGCVQSLRKIGIWRQKGLSFAQKMGYTSCLLYWHTYLRRFIYIMSPILFAVFGIPVVECSLLMLIICWLPSYFLYNKTLKVLSGNIRTTRWSNIYDTILMPALLIPILKESIGIKQRNFSVTIKKRQETDKLYVLRQALPHMILAVLSVIGVLRCINYSMEYKTIGYVIILFWLCVNLYSIIMSLFFMFSRKAYRNSERFYTEIPVAIETKNGILRGKTKDISEGGFSFVTDFPEYLPAGEHLWATMESEREKARILVTVKQIQEQNEKWVYGVEIVDMDEENKNSYYQIVYDREPTLPKYIEGELSVFEDVFDNIHRRFAFAMPSQRKLPRINVNEKVMTKENNTVRVQDFNYEYITVVAGLWNPGEKLTIPIHQNLSIRCSFVQEKSVTIGKDREGVAKYRLYKVENVDELIQSDEFRLKIQQWIENDRAQCRRAVLLEIQNKQKERPDELDEMELIRQRREGKAY